MFARATSRIARLSSVPHSAAPRVTADDVVLPAVFVASFGMAIASILNMNESNKHGELDVIHLRDYLPVCAYGILTRPRLRAREMFRADLPLAKKGSVPFDELVKPR